MFTSENIISALPGVAFAIGAFAVMGFRISDLSRRVTSLEANERNHSERVIKMETQLDTAIRLLARIEAKIDAK